MDLLTLLDRLTELESDTDLASAGAIVYVESNTGDYYEIVSINHTMYGNILIQVKHK